MSCTDGVCTRNCPPCPPIGCFKEGKGQNIQQVPCSSKEVTFTEGKPVSDYARTDCLANPPPDDCACTNKQYTNRVGESNGPNYYPSMDSNRGGDYHPKYLQPSPDSLREQHESAMAKKADESKFPPCYLPQPNDDLIKDTKIEPSGEHAGHMVDCGLLAGRVTAVDWRMNNRNLLTKTCNALLHTKRTDFDCKNTMARAYAIIDKTQAASTQSVKERSELVTKWKCTLERAIEAMIDEITSLSQERIRLKQSLVVLGMPYSIATECLQRRCTRPESERIYDQPEEEVYNELELIDRIRNVFNKTLADVETQQEENRRHRQRLEMDWSDKKVSNEIETMNKSLNNHSTIILFHPGANRFPADQSSEEFWEHFSTDILNDAEKCRQKSVALRSTLNGILMNAARDLRTQADTVELAFTARINCMEEVEKRLTAELKDCLQKLADTENLIVKMTRGIASLDAGMKVCQTRLDNRTQRPNVENCRDQTQFKLVAEVGTIQNGMNAMQQAAQEAENTKQLLMDTRTQLEKEIMLKRRTIAMDRERCMLIRSHFPSATQLSGYAKV